MWKAALLVVMLSCNSKPREQRVTIGTRNFLVPGPATIKTLVKYAAMCGVGNSARFIRKQALNITKLLTVSSPDAFVENLARLHFEKPELGIAGPHLYPFGGFDKLLDWVSSRMP